MVSVGQMYLFCIKKLTYKIRFLLDVHLVPTRPASQKTNMTTVQTTVQRTHIRFESSDSSDSSDSESSGWSTDTSEHSNHSNLSEESEWIPETNDTHQMNQHNQHNQHKGDEHRTPFELRVSDFEYSHWPSDTSLDTEESEYIPDSDSSEFSDSSDSETEHVIDYGEMSDDEEEEDQHTKNPDKPETIHTDKPQLTTSMETSLATRRMRENRYGFAKILANNTTSFTDPNYDEIEVFYDIGKNGKQIQFEYLLPRINETEYRKNGESFGIPISKNDTFYVYVNIMNMEDDIPFDQEIDMFVHSNYSLKVIQEFAVYACNDQFNIMKSSNAKFGTVSYWMRIPTYLMTLRNAFTLDKVIQYNMDTGAREATSFKESQHGLFSVLLDYIRVDPMGKAWYDEEVEGMCGE